MSQILKSINLYSNELCNMVISKEDILKSFRSWYLNRTIGYVTINNNIVKAFIFPSLAMGGFNIYNIKYISNEEYEIIDYAEELIDNNEIINFIDSIVVDDIDNNIIPDVLSIYFILSKRFYCYRLNPDYAKDETINFLNRIYRSENISFTYIYLLMNILVLHLPIGPEYNIKNLNMSTTISVNYLMYNRIIDYINNL